MSAEVEDARPQHGWHLKREIQLGHIITTIAMAAAVSLYVSKIDQRLALLEQDIKYRREVDDQQDQTAERMNQAIDKRLEKIEHKLDTLIERGIRK